MAAAVRHLPAASCGRGKPPIQPMFGYRQTIGPRPDNYPLKQIQLNLRIKSSIMFSTQTATSGW